MKLAPINLKTSFRADEGNAPSVSSAMSTTAINALSGVAVGGIVGAARCALPVSKNEIASKVAEGLVVYKKANVPIAGEVSKLSSDLNIALNNKEWFDFINQVQGMADDVFIKKSDGLARKVDIQTAGGSLFKKSAAKETITKTQIIEAARKKLIGKNPAMPSESFIKDLSDKFSKKSAELFEEAKRFMSENPKDELVQLSKKVAKKARNSRALSSSIRFGVMAALVFGIIGALKSNKKSNSK